MGFSWSSSWAESMARWFQGCSTRFSVPHSGVQEATGKEDKHSDRGQIELNEMNKTTHKGYSGRGLAVLKEHGVTVWSDVKVPGRAGEFRGIILPRSETADANHIVLKLNNGYNIGLDAGPSIDGRERETGGALQNS